MLTEQDSEKRPHTMNQTKRAARQQIAEPRNDHILYPPPETQDLNAMGSLMSQSNCHFAKSQSKGF